MPVPADILFTALADPTRRAIFERLSRAGELTVRALTEPRGCRSRRYPSISAC